MSNWKDKIVKNTIFTMVDNVIVYAVPFLLFPYTVKHLGAELSGIWFLCTGILGYFTVFDQGPTPAVIKYTAEHYAKRDFKAINSYLSSAMLLFALFGLISFVIMVLFALVGGAFVKVSAPQLVVFREVFSLMGVILLVMFPFRVFPAALRGLQEYKVTSLANITGSISRFALTIALLAHGYGIYALLAINFITLAISCAIPMVYQIVRYPQIRISRHEISREHLTNIAEFGGITFVISLCAVLIFQTDRIFLGVLVSMQAITFYSACKQIYDVCRFLPVVILQAIMPLASELKASNNVAIIEKLLYRGTKYSYALFIPIGVFSIFMAEDILRVWVGPDFAKNSIALQILIVHLFFNFCHQAGTQILIGINKIRFTVPYYVIALAMNLSLNVLLVKKYGILGVAVSTSVPFICLEWFYMKKMLNHLEIGYWTFAKNALTPVVPLFFAAVLACSCIKYFMVFSGVASLLITAVLFFTGMMTLFVAACIPSGERSTFVNLISPGRSM
jgi:O-antigen/teichoic acid export membrane protein